MTLRNRLVAALLGITIVVAAGFWLKRHIEIDHCLDQGGRWDHARAACDS